MNSAHNIRVHLLNIPCTLKSDLPPNICIHLPHHDVYRELL